MVNASTGPLDLLRFGTFLLELVSSSGVLSKKPLQNFVAIGGDAGDGGGKRDIGFKAETSFPSVAPRERKRGNEIAKRQSDTEPVCALMRQSG